MPLIKGAERHRIGIASTSTWASTPGLISRLDFDIEIRRKPILLFLLVRHFVNLFKSELVRYFVLSVSRHKEHNLNKHCVKSCAFAWIS